MSFFFSSMKWITNSPSICSCSRPFVKFHDLLLPTSQFAHSWLQAALWRSHNRTRRTRPSTLYDSFGVLICGRRASLHQVAGMATAPTETGDPGPEQPSTGRKQRDKPVCLIVLGMAGSGKTTFVQVRTRRERRELILACLC